MADARADWAAFAPREIPTKADFAPLERWLAALPCSSTRACSSPGTAAAADAAALPPRVRILDLGCGTGAITLAMAQRGFDVTGIDINAGAVAEAAASAPANCRFLADDVAAPHRLPVPARSFDGVVCQLLLSIIGTLADRRQLLVNAHAALAPGGRLFASLSGRSEDINHGYARLYHEDAALTGEFGTYLSRDATGKVLYQTHHFLPEEARALLAEAGFVAIAIDECIETSSRRHDQVARFLYISAAVDGSGP